MKKQILFAFIIFTTIYTGYSQKMGRERIKALKATSITNAIDLTASEAEKFWPVYNKYTNKNQELKISIESRKYREIKKSENFDTISESEAKQILDNRIELETEILNNKIALYKELSKIISAKKILKLQSAERNFNKKLLQEFGRRRGMNKQ